MNTPNSNDRLDQLVDRTLIAGIPPGLKASVDRLLAMGEHPTRVIGVVRAAALRAAGGKPNEGKLTVAAVEAYLASLGHAKPEGGAA